LIGLCLDLMIRTRTRGRKSLDDVMRALWEQYGKTGLGVAENGIEKLAAQVAGTGVRGFFDKALRSTEELPLKRVLATVGVAMLLRTAESPSDQGGKAATATAASSSRRVSLGVRTTEDPAGARLSHVLDAGAAQAAGLSAGDVVVAVDGLKVSAKNIDLRLARYQPGNIATLHAFRRDELMEVEVELRASPVDTCALAVVASDRAAANRRRAWLQEES
jgi:predicted metalloprotease with PDZ domain